MRYPREWAVKIEELDKRAKTAKGTVSSKVTGAFATWHLGKQESHWGNREEKRHLDVHFTDRGNNPGTRYSLSYGTPRPVRNAILRAVDRRMAGLEDVEDVEAEETVAVVDVKPAKLSAAARTLPLPFDGPAKSKAAKKKRKAKAAKKRKPAKPAKRKSSRGRPGSRKGPKAKRAKKPAKKKGARRAKR